mgnify:CR=1 FL=1
MKLKVLIEENKVSIFAWGLHLDAFTGRDSTAVSGVAITKSTAQDKRRQVRKEKSSKNVVSRMSVMWQI